MKVGTTEYGLDDFAGFRKELTRQLGDGLSRVEALLGEISTDMFTEKLSFADWPAVLEEVSIRNVGYRVEAAMRARMVEHEGRYCRQKEEVERNIEQAERDWAADRKKPAAERKFQFEDDMKAYVHAQRDMTMANVLGYCKASYMTRYQGDWRIRELFRWVIGEETREPLNMNCWEAVLFALVKTGLVDKTYLGWCNSAGVRANYPGREKEALFILLFQQLINDMDGYWGQKDPAFGTDATKKRASQAGFIPPVTDAASAKAMFLIPQDIIIPRGRILMFNCGAHVAISTGKLARIENRNVRERFNIEWGHGMLELDGGYGAGGTTKTIREGVIEDLCVDREFYLVNLVVAPFPRCTTTGTVTLTGVPKVPVKDEPDLVTAIAEYLEAHSADIEREKARARAQADRKMAVLSERQETLMAKTEPAATEAELAAVEIDIAKARAGALSQIKQIDTKWSSKAANDDKVKAAQKAAPDKVKLPETIVFNYNINNPYDPSEG